jgi:hypothetical protein
MNDETHSRNLNPHRWGTIFATLSLDIVVPYIPSMHLQLPPWSEFVMGLRAIIEEFRLLQALDSTTRFSFAETVFEWAANEYGGGFVAHLFQWGEEVFQIGDGVGASAFLWRNIVRQGRLDGSSDVDLRLGFVPAIREELARRPTPKVEQAPRSTWDLELYKRHAYDRLMNPMELVKSTISYCNFLSAWQAAVEEYPTPDLERVYAWGAAEAERLGVPVDRLGKPGNWPPLPRPWMKSDL